MVDWQQTLLLRLASEQDISELRLMVNAAYRELADKGLNFTGTFQDDAVTLERMRGKEVVLAYLDDRLVGTISLRVKERAGELQVLYISQLAVSPQLKRSGIGRYLLHHAEHRARALGLTRLQLDTAVPAQHLVMLYQSLGYQVIDEVQWEGKTYQSYVMEKLLGEI